MTLRTERAYPWAVGILATAATVHWASGASIKGALPTALSDAVTVSSVIVGFFGTAATILVGMANQAIDRIRQSGYWHDLLGYLWAAIWSAIAVAVVSLTMRFAFDALPAPWRQYSFGVWVGAVTSMLLCTYRMMRVLRNILANPK